MAEKADDTYSNQVEDLDNLNDFLLETDAFDINDVELVFVLSGAD